MQIPPPKSSEASAYLQGTPDFSLVLGGPLFQLLRRAHLSDDAMMMARRRVIVISLVAWLPLLLLSILEGRVRGGTAVVPFLFDVEVHVRYLVALPLLIAAELVVHRRMRFLVRQFVVRRLIPETAMPRFEAAVTSALRLRNSTLAEILLIAFVYGVGILVIWRQYMALDTATWYGMPTPDGTKLSLAGMWYGYVSLPLFQFILCRWYFRLFIWTRFLWQVSRIQLTLIPLHPDRLAGLGFLSGTAYAFALILVAHGAILAGPLANRILYLGARLLDFKAEIVAMVVFVLGLVVAPLLVFTPQLARAKRRGLREYGVLAEDYVREFHARWMRDGGVTQNTLESSGDVQGLADLGNSYEVVRTMRATPVTREMLLQLGAATLVPVAPLVLTMMPLDELVKTLFGLLF